LNEGGAGRDDGDGLLAAEVAVIPHRCPINGRLLCKSVSASGMGNFFKKLSSLSLFSLSLSSPSLLPRIHRCWCRCQHPGTSRCSARCFRPPCPRLGVHDSHSPTHTYAHTLSLLSLSLTSYSSLLVPLSASRYVSMQCSLLKTTVPLRKSSVNARARLWVRRSCRLDSRRIVVCSVRKRVSKEERRKDQEFLKHSHTKENNRGTCMRITPVISSRSNRSIKSTRLCESQSERSEWR
jgi:hypothetical protein